MVSSNTTSGPAPLDRELLERGLVRSRRAAADLLVDVRRRHAPRPRRTRRHTYAQAGQVHGAAVRLRRRQHDALDADRRSASGTPPTPTILSPQDGITFRAGDVISFSGRRNRPGRRHAAGERLHLEHRLPPRGPRAPGHSADRREERDVHDSDDRSRLQRQHPLPDRADRDGLGRSDVDHVGDHLAAEGQPHLRHRPARASRSTSTASPR